ncbi:DUF308 domain-containing protein [Rhodocaloribacter litoris]|uniref:HdeD family acid-resistance protein n=1 Tax=Rhodocaloribacter litoris TaxID=2558931 RepID=UPI0014228943|nr:DUF308 domain-containing protein [Rhodocaloribacter litoris]QXD13767.1 DUF308 domain-containing protein [Rhodocaloribacter litoris]
MILIFTRSWTSLLLRGLLAILFGVLALLWPQLTLHVLVILFGAFALIDGVLGVTAAVRGRRVHPLWWLLLLDGVLSLLFGVAALVWPQITAIVLVYLIAFWALFTGFVELLAAWRLRKVVKGEWLLALSGVLSVLFGFGLALFPGAGALALVTVIAVFAILYGAVLVALALKVRRLRRWAEEQFAATLPG